MSDRDRLIAALVGDLPAVSPWRRPRTQAVLWLLTSVVFVTTVSALLGPWRPGFAGQLLTSLPFAAEILLASVGLVVIIALAFLTAVPGAIRASRALIGGLIAVLPWLALLFAGLWAPALEPSMLGKRAACHMEVLVLSVPPLVLGMILLRRLYPLRGWVSGALTGAAAGLIPAIAMQMACMYVVPHALIHHLLPVAAPVLAGAAIGGWWLGPVASASGREAVGR